MNCFYLQKRLRDRTQSVGIFRFATKNVFLWDVVRRFFVTLQAGNLGAGACYPIRQRGFRVISTGDCHEVLPIANLLVVANVLLVAGVQVVTSGVLIAGVLVSNSLVAWTQFMKLREEVFLVPITASTWTQAEELNGFVGFRVDAADDAVTVDPAGSLSKSWSD